MSDDLIRFHDEHDRFLKEQIQTIERLKRKLRGDHPDSVTLAEANDNMPVQISLNDPSLPTYMKEK